MNDIWTARTAWEGYAEIMISSDDEKFWPSPGSTKARA